MDGKMRIQTIIWVIFLIFLSGSGFSQDNRNNSTIELESEGVCLFKKGDSKQITKKLACFNAKKTAVELAGKYFKRKKLVEPYEHRKDEIYSILADEINEDIIKETWTSTGDISKYFVQIRVKITPVDFIRAEILNLEYEKKEAKTTLRKKMEPPISKKIEPGHDLAHAYRLLRKGQWRVAVIYLDRLEMKYPNLGEIQLAKSFAYYAMHEIEAVKTSLENACRLGTEEACDDLSKIKRLQEYNFNF
jgi:tetratricopeptide (TPR) repeat protein